MSDMLNNDLSFGASINHSNQSYLFMEDVVAQLQLTNHGDTSLSVPFLKNTHDLLIRLTHLATGSVLEISTFRTGHGVPAVIMESMTYELDAGADVVFDLTLQSYFGTLHPGDYHVEFRLTRGAAVLTGEPIPFTVLPGHITMPTLTNGTAIDSDSWLLAWIDEQSDGNHLMWRHYSANPRGSGLFTQKVTTSSPPSSAVAVSQAPPGKIGELSWLAWIDGKMLRFVQADQEGTHRQGNVQLDAPVALATPVLIDPDRTTDETGFELAVVSDADGGAIETVSVDQHGVPIGSRLLSLGYPPANLTAVQADGDRRWCLWSRPIGNERFRLMIARWQADGSLVLLGDLGESAGALIGLTAQADETKLQVAVLAQTEQSADTQQLLMSILSLPLPLESASSFRVTRHDSAFAAVGTLTTGELALDANHQAWAIVSDQNMSSFLIGSALADPVDLDLPESARYPLLALPRHRPPQVIYLSHTDGWVVKRVAF